MQELIDSHITRFNSENAQIFMFSNLPKRIEILEREKYLFLPKNWIEDEDLVALKFIANQRNYTIEFADNSPMFSTDLIFKEIESAIKIVTGLERKDYAVSVRKIHLFYVRVIYQTIALSYKIERFLIAQKLHKTIQIIKETESKHQDLFKYTPEYRRIFNDVMQVIINNKNL